MTPTEYKSLPANLQRDVRVALACGYGWSDVSFGPSLNRSSPILVVRQWATKNLCVWRDWRPTTDTTIWTALANIGERCHLAPRSKTLWEAWFGNALADLSNTRMGASQGEAVCAAFVAADPLGHLGRAGV